MHRRTKQIAAILALVAMAIFTLPLCIWFYTRAANASLVERTRSLVEKNPQLQPAWERAMQDAALSASEAENIEKLAGEKGVTQK